MANQYGDNSKRQTDEIEVDKLFFFLFGVFESKIKNSNQDNTNAE